MSVYDVLDGVTLETETCCKCGLPFGLEVGFQKQRRRDRETFYCPNGHPQHYIGKSDEQKRREAAEAELAREKRAREWAEELAAAHRRDARGKAILLGKEKAKRVRIEERVAHGVCPCCTRTFKQLAAHMAKKHPEYQAKKRRSRNA